MTKILSAFYICLLLSFSANAQLDLNKSIQLDTMHRFETAEGGQSREFSLYQFNNEVYLSIAEYLPNKTDGIEHTYKLSLPNSEPKISIQNVVKIEFLKNKDPKNLADLLSPVSLNITNKDSVVFSATLDISNSSNGHLSFISKWERAYRNKTPLYTLSNYDIKYNSTDLPLSICINQNNDSLIQLFDFYLQRRDFITFDVHYSDTISNTLRLDHQSLNEYAINNVFFEHLEGLYIEICGVDFE